MTALLPPVDLPIPETKPLRHKWGEPVLLEHQTERTCEHCNLVKITRHEQGNCWREWRHPASKNQFAMPMTPPCRGKGK